MAKKRTHGRSGSAKTASKKKRTGSTTSSAVESVASMAESEETLHSAWNDLIAGMEDRILENIENQQTTYQDFYGKWMKLMGKMGNRMTRTRPGHNYREAYDVWRNYANGMNHRLTRMISKGKETHEKIDEYWQSYLRSIGEEINRASVGDMKPHEFKGVYEAWTGFAGEMQEDIRSTTDLGTKELKEMTEVWHDFSNEMQDIVKDLTEDGNNFDELADIWTNASREIGNSLEAMLDENNGSLERLQETWDDYCSKLERKIVDTSRKMGVNYDELSKWYFDNQKAWYGWWNRSSRTDGNYLKKQMEELQHRVGFLENR